MQLNNSITNNIDKLPLEAIGMFNILFQGKIEGFEDAYMVEVKIDDPIKHIEDGDEFFIIHQNMPQYQHHAEHLWDKNWAVMHKDTFRLTETDEDRFNILLKKYFETGKIAEKKEKKHEEYPVLRKRF